MARRRLQPAVALRLILRNCGKVLQAGVTVSLVFLALTLVGLVVLLGKSIRLTRRQRRAARGLVGRLSWRRFSPDR